MSAYIANRLEVLIASESKFGQFYPYSSHYQEIRPFLDGFDHAGTLTMHPIDDLRPTLTASKQIPGMKQAKASLPLPARGGGRLADAGVQAQMHPELDLLMQSVSGEVLENTGLALSGGSWSYVTNESGAPSDSVTLGALIFIDTDGDGHWQPRWVSDIDDATNRITFSGDWKGASAWELLLLPTSEAVLAAGVQCISSNDSPSSLCMQVSGIESGGSIPVWKYTGLVADLKITDTPAEAVMLSFSLTGDAYEIIEGEKSVSQEAGAESCPSSPAFIKALRAELRLSGLPVSYAGFEVDIGNRFAEMPDSSAANGRAGFALTKRETTGKISLYWNSEHMQSLETGECIDISWVAGEPANAIGFHAPNCQIIAIEEVERNGLLMMEMSFAVLESDMDNIPDWTIAFTGARTI